MEPDKYAIYKILGSKIIMIWMYRLMHSMIRQMWLLIDLNVYFEYVKNKKRQTRITVQQQITKKRKAKEKSNTDDFVYIFKHW